MDGELQWSGRRVEWPACYIKTTKLGAERLFFLRIVPWVGWSGLEGMEWIDCYNTSSIDNFLLGWIERWETG